MKCEPTQTPDVDISALRIKYLQERDKRVRGDGREQYILPEGEFANYHLADPYMPTVARDPISQDIDVAILGAGFSGLLAAYHLKNAGITNFRNIDLGGDFGGTWYWNRYPGIECDNDAYCYIPLLEELAFIPSKKYAGGAEIYEHCRRIARQYGLYESALFHTMVRAMRWDDGIKRWRLDTNRGDDIRARFVILALGPHGRLKLPGIPGITSFKGHTFHSSRWDYGYTGGNPDNPTLDKLADKRVAIIGTGATAIQIVPCLGRYAKHVYVFQRTPSYVDDRHNTPTDPEWAKSLKPGWQKARQINHHRGALEGFAPGEPDVICDFWTEINRNIAAKLGAQGWPESTPAKYGELFEIEDYRVMERLRRHIDSIVRDKKTAETLKPYYRFMCKRSCSNDDYYPTCNRPNVTLIDVSSNKGVERMTEKGLVGNGVEYEVDCVVYATGFESSGDLNRRTGIETIDGRNGQSLYDYWANGFRTFQGMMSHGFPNQFHIGFLQGALNANVVVNLDVQANHIAYIIKEVVARAGTTVEPTEEAQNAWVKLIRESTVDRTSWLRECTPGYYNSEGEETVKGLLGEQYGAGFSAYEQLLQEWRDSGKMTSMVLASR